MLKYVLCVVVILFLIVDGAIYLDLRKYIKAHENELVENNIKGLMCRSIGMIAISLGVGVIGIILVII